MPVTPFITREVQPTNVLKGANVTLTCIATTSSQSSVEVEWIKDNKVQHNYIKWNCFNMIKCFLKFLVMATDGFFYLKKSGDKPNVHHHFSTNTFD
jgi:hypothetical protein